MIQEQLPILILAIPLLMSLVISVFARKSKTLSYVLLTAAMAGSFASSVSVLRQVLASGKEIHYYLGSWPAPYGIELVIDHLNAMVLCLVSGVALLTAIYSKYSVLAEIPDRFPNEEVPERVPNYYTLYALLVTGLLGMVATGDAFNLYVLLEISALASYALLALGRERAYYATFKYVIMGTIGACFYLLGVGYLYIKTGSLNMADLKIILSNTAMHQSDSIQIAFLLIIIGLWIKMAFFPMHGWLPNAYTFTSNTTSCLVAPLMTKVTVYMMIRMMFSVFSVQFIFETIDGTMVCWLAAVAIIFGSLSALGQTNLKRMLSYIIVAEVGYMVGGAWLANANGLTGAIYHILSDAMMTLCLFMAVGAIIYKTGESSFEAMRGIFRKMPVTSAVFLVGASAMVGIPPTCGFFSKWYLISGAIEAGQWGFMFALLFSSLVNAFIFFRLIEIGYFPAFNKGEQNQHGSHGHDVVDVNEAPISMLIPMVITALSLLAIGIYTNEIVSGLIRYTIPQGLL